VSITDPVEKCLFRQFKQVKTSTTLGELSVVFYLHSFAVVTNDDEQVVGVVSRIDLLSFLSKLQMQTSQ